MSTCITEWSIPALQSIIYMYIYIYIYIYISGTKDFPQYNIDGLTLPFDSI